MMSIKQVLVVDLNVIKYHILDVCDKLDRVMAVYDLNRVVEAQMHYVVSGRWLIPVVSPENQAAGIVRFNGQPNVIWVNDTKPYWRSQYLLRDEVWSQVRGYKGKVRQEPAPIQYKGGRRKSTTKLNLIYSSMRMVISRNRWQMLEGYESPTMGYEADDIAALLVRLNEASRDPSHIYLLTCDHDWLGLVGEHCSWLNTYGTPPRYRTKHTWNTGYEWLPLSDPSSIWAYKAGSGDKSDNLPNVKGDPDGTNVLLPVISLREPVAAYDPMNNPSMVRAAKSALEGQAAAISEDIMTKLSSSPGMPICLRPIRHR